MADEEKTITTETEKKTTAKKTTQKKTTTPRKKSPPKPKEKTYTQAETEAMIQAAVEAALAKHAAETPQTTRIFTTQTDELVTVVFIAETSPNDILVIPGYGSLRPSSSLDIPKKEFGGQFMSNLVRKLIDKRYLIVANGLTEDERIRYNCNYKEGEVLDERTFDRLLDYPTDKLCEIFEKLCVEHKRFVARKIITAHEKKDRRISLAKVKAINDLSKADDPDGMLKPVMEAYARELV